MATDLLDTFLSQEEKDAVAVLAANPLLLGALKKIMLADVHFKGVLRKNIAPDPTRNAAIAFAFNGANKSNEDLGADIRAFAEGVRLVESGFDRIEKLKKGPAPADKKGNPAR